MQLWHRRFGHTSPCVLIRTCRKNGIRYLADLKESDLHCKLWKIDKKTTFKPIGSIRSEHPLDLFYADVCHPCKIGGIQGERYVLSIMDDRSLRVSIYPIKLMSDVFDIVKSHNTRAENFLGRKL